MANNFRLLVEEMVSQIPDGRFMTYGQLAALAGQPLAARVVGGIAHYGNPLLPWHRVVNKKGNLASGYPGGRAVQKRRIEAEGVSVTDMQVEIAKLIWWP